MNKSSAVRRFTCRQDGAVLPLVAVCLVVLAAFLALAVDLGRLYVSRNELQNAADAAALGSTRQLAKIYQSSAFQALSTYEQRNYNVTLENLWDVAVRDNVVVIRSAQDVALQNQAANEGIVIDSNDVLLGAWEPDDPDRDGDRFRLDNVRPTAVRVTARRDGSNVSGNISTFFAGVFGVESSPVVARATAALTGQSTAEQGELELPIGVSRKWFTGPPSDWCGNVVKFSPTTDPAACAGWTTFKYSPANDITIRNILLPEDDKKHLESPYNEVNDFFIFTNGTLSEGSFENLLGEYMRKGVDVDRVYNSNMINQPLPTPITDSSQKVPLCWDGASNAVVECDASNLSNQLRYPPCSGASGCNGPLRYAHEWETTIIVYDDDMCNPNTSLPILGYAKVTVFNVGFPSNQVVEARIECDIIDNEDTRGGGANFGTFGSIAGLVE